MRSSPAEVESALDISERRQRLIATFGQLALQKTSIPDLLNAAVQHVAEGVDVPLVKVLQPDTQTDDLLVTAGVGWKPGTVGQARLPSGRRSPPGRAYQTGESVAIRDLPNDPAYDYSDLLRDHGVVSVINVPIKDKYVFGVLEVDAGHKVHWTRADVDFLQAFANLLMAAVLRREAEDHLTLLLQEIQHRVKNNLQLIAAMLNIYARRSSNLAARRDFEEVSRRVIVIGSLYQMLVRSDGAGRISVRDFIGGVCQKLQSSTANENIQIECSIQDVEASFDEVIPIGLAVNELVMNAIEHAFPETGGHVHIRLRYDDAANLGELTIADNGLGMSADAKPGFGLQAISMLLRQVQGTMEQLGSGQGTVFRIVFQLARGSRSGT
jgi:two-component system, sensor histidine kinase PdtaS